jgi:hypothetical protein
VPTRGRGHAIASWVYAGDNALGALRSGDPDRPRSDGHRSRTIADGDPRRYAAGLRVDVDERRANEGVGWQVGGVDRVTAVRGPDASCTQGDALRSRPSGPERLAFVRSPSRL